MLLEPVVTVRPDDEHNTKRTLVWRFFPLLLLGLPFKPLFPLCPFLILGEGVKGGSAFVSAFGDSTEAAAFSGFSSFAFFGAALGGVEACLRLSPVRCIVVNTISSRIGSLPAQ